MMGDDQGSCPLFVTNFLTYYDVSAPLVLLFPAWALKQAWLIRAGKQSNEQPNETRNCIPSPRQSPSFELQGDPPAHPAVCRWGFNPSV